MGLRTEFSNFRLGRILSSSWRRGRNGSGIWVAIAAVGTTFRVLRHLSKRKPRVDFRRELKPGESLRIDHLERGTDDRP